MTQPLQTHIAAVRDALEFYAEHRNWMELSHRDGIKPFLVKTRKGNNGDGWEVAEQALESLSAIEAAVTSDNAMENVVWAAMAWKGADIYVHPYLSRADAIQEAEQKLLAALGEYEKTVQPKQAIAAHAGEKEQSK